VHVELCAETSLIKICNDLMSIIILILSRDGLLEGDLLDDLLFWFEMCRSSYSSVSSGRKRSESIFRLLATQVSPFVGLSTSPSSVNAMSFVS